MPRLLREASVRSVLVLGPCSGRQYGFLGEFELSGVDISPKLVRTCKRRYPHIPTTVGDVRALECAPVDAIVSSAVLQHVRPDEISFTLGGLRRIARLLVIRETTRLAAVSDYQFAHDYRALMLPWRPVFELVTDEREAVTVEMFAFAAPG